MDILAFDIETPKQLKFKAQLLAAGFRPHAFIEDELECWPDSLATPVAGVCAIVIAEAQITANLVRRLRQVGADLPILIFSEAKSSESIARFLDAGADDIVLYPFSRAEIVSRINSIVRRGHGHSSESLTIGEITVFFDGRDPIISGETVPLSKREYDIFLQLAINADKTVSRNTIYDALYSMSPDQPFDKVIDVYICKLRKKISEATASGFNYILTVRGRGYRFCQPQ